MNSELIHPHLDAQRFSIKWQTFGVISLVLASLVLAFSLLMSTWNERQFESSRVAIHDQYEQQLARLVETSADKTIQLAHAASLNRELMEAVRADNEAVIASELDALDWNLQADSGLSVLGFYNLRAQPLYGQDFSNHQESVETVLNLEQPSWQVDCSGLCRIVTYTAMLYQGDVAGVLILSEPLSNVMLKFQHVANIDTVLLSGLASKSDSESQAIVPLWEKELVALTNPSVSEAILNRASEHYSLEELSQRVHVLDLHEKTYELKAMPIEQSQVVVISNVSKDYSLLDQAQSQTLQYSLIALVIGELCLLLFLRQPLRKISRADAIEHLVQEQSEVIETHSLALAQAKNLSDSLTDSLTAGVLLLNRQGFIKFANPYIKRILGLSAQGMAKLRLDDLLQSDERFLSQRVDDVTKGVISEFEQLASLRSSSGHSHRLVWRFVPVYRDSEDANGRPQEREVLAIAMPLSQPSIEKEIQWIERYDRETGLLNRKGLDELLSAAADQQENKEDCLVLVRLSQPWTSAMISATKLALDHSASLARLEENELAIFFSASVSDSVYGSEDSHTALIAGLDKALDAILPESVVHTLASTTITSRDRKPFELIQCLRDELARKV